MLINAYVTSSPGTGRRRAQGRLGLRGRVARQRRPGLRRRGRAWPPEVETHLVNAVLTNGARYYVDHAHPELLHARVRRRPVDRGLRPGGRADPRSGRWRRPGALLPDGPGDRRLQEQLRRQGQLLRLPRELPDGPRGAVRRASSPHVTAALHHPPDLHRRRQGRQRGAGPDRRRRAVPAQPAGRLLRGGGRPRDHAEAADRQHPRRAARRRPASTGACTSSSATPTCPRSPPS